MSRVFISHSYVDAVLAKAVSDLLIASLGLASDDVRCSSSPDHAVPSGADIKATLTCELDQTELLVVVLTPQSIRSAWVGVELGYALAQKRPIVPLTHRFNLAVSQHPLAGVKGHRVRDGSMRAFLDQAASRLRCAPQEAAADALETFAAQVKALPVAPPREFLQYASADALRSALDYFDVPVPRDKERQIDELARCDGEWPDKLHRALSHDDVKMVSKAYGLPYGGSKASQITALLDGATGPNGSAER